MTRVPEQHPTNNEHPVHWPETDRDPVWETALLGAAQAVVAHAIGFRVGSLTLTVERVGDTTDAVANITIDNAEPGLTTSVPPSDPRVLDWMVIALAGDAELERREHRPPRPADVVCESGVYAEALTAAAGGDASVVQEQWERALTILHEHRRSVQRLARTLAMRHREPVRVTHSLDASELAALITGEARP